MMKVTKLENTMEPLTGSMRQGLHAALDDLMNDVEKEVGAVTGGTTTIRAEGHGYRHTLTLTVSIVTETLSSPNLN